jgi:hypothetical protein
MTVLANETVDFEREEKRIRIELVAAPDFRVFAGVLGIDDCILATNRTRRNTSTRFGMYARPQGDF